MPVVKEGTFDKNSLTRLTLLIMSSTLLPSPLIMLSLQPLYQGQARRGRGQGRERERGKKYRIAREGPSDI